NCSKKSSATNQEIFALLFASLEFSKDLCRDQERLTSPHAIVNQPLNSCLPNPRHLSQRRANGRTPTPMGLSMDANGVPSSNAARHNLPEHFIGGNHLAAAAPSSVKDFVA